ncbi:MAG: RidA family protein [Eudoraea sp.]|nr:RidA family protein [Eudoraea sp.]
MKILIVRAVMLLSIALLFYSCNPVTEKPVGLNPVSKSYYDQHNGYSEAVVITSASHKTIYISGQIGDGQDLETQMRSAIEKLKALLDKMGGSTSDIVKMNTYIVGYDEVQLESFRKVRKELLGDEKMPASTLVGVQSLAKKDWLIEIDAVAVIPL